VTRSSWSSWPDILRQLTPKAIELDLFGLYAHSPATVRVNFVSSANGTATVDGRSAGLSGPGDRRLLQVLRALADVVVVGAGTVRAEGYGSVRPPGALQEWRRAHGMPPGPQLAVVSGSLALDPDSEVFSSTPVRPIILTGAHPPAARVDALSVVAEVVAADSPGRWLALLAERGMTRVLCEGGARLFGSLLAAGLVDELCLTLSPRLAAEDGPGVVARIAPPRPLSLMHVLEEDGFLFLRYAISRG